MSPAENQTPQHVSGRKRFLQLFLVFSTAVLCAVTPLRAGDAGKDQTQVRFDEIIERIASKYTVDPLLVKALIWRESRFLPRSKGAAGEIGLMQIKMAVVKDWAKAKGKEIPNEEEVFDPYLNIEIGTWHLSRALKNWEGNPDCYALALCEYNAGRTRLLRWIAHYDGSCLHTVKYSASAKYVRDITDKFIEYSLDHALLGMFALRDEPQLSGDEG